ncbi:MAG: anti-sigma factor antagonist [Candidatus Makaraimicrobium thalassicum]|nr:MAG: anti-sigma factor antagonist [Candidatus Omnitrophota bacterium]
MEIKREESNGIVIFRVAGDIDLNTSPELKKFFDQVIKENKKKILIDLKDVSYVDSSGLATLVEILKNLRVYGGRLKLTSLSAKVRGLFEITRLDKLFDISAGEEDALSSFNEA